VYPAGAFVWRLCQPKPDTRRKRDSFGWPRSHRTVPPMPTRKNPAVDDLGHPTRRRAAPWPGADARCTPPVSGAPRDRKHQGPCCRTQPSQSALNLTVWVTRRPPPAPNPGLHTGEPLILEATPPGRRTPASPSRTHARCASGSCFLNSAHRWSAGSALEPGEDPACLGPPHHGSERHHLTAYGTGCADHIKGPPQQGAPRHVP